ncbi:MAG: hypothetical protein AAF050_22040 [Cyanobacteria bacterium J06649_5]
MLRLTKSSQAATVYRDQQIEDERMRDVEMLLESLFLREEATLRLVLDCLYDIGAINLVNQKVRSRPLNRLMKAIARWSKPVFRPFMVRWSKKNCPGMIASWLHSQVRFSQSEVLLPEVLAPEEGDTLSN